MTTGSSNVKQQCGSSRSSNRYDIADRMMRSSRPLPSLLIQCLEWAGTPIFICQDSLRLTSPPECEGLVYLIVVKNYLPLRRGGRKYASIGGLLFTYSKSVRDRPAVSGCGKRGSSAGGAEVSSSGLPNMYPRELRVALFS